MYLLRQAGNKDGILGQSVLISQADVSKKAGRIFLAGCSEFVEKILYMAGVFSLVDRQKNVQDALCLLKGQRQMQMEVSASGE